MNTGFPLVSGKKPKNKPKSKGLQAPTFDYKPETKKEGKGKGKQTEWMKYYGIPGKASKEDQQAIAFVEQNINNGSEVIQKEVERTILNLRNKYSQ